MQERIEQNALELLHAIRGSIGPPGGILRSSQVHDYAKFAARFPQSSRSMARS